MLDLEGLATGPETCILTIAAQGFDPFGDGYYQDKSYYARVTLESQEHREIDQNTLEWWATQPPVVRDEAFAEDGRIPLDQALDELGRLIWHSNRIWAQGPTYDMTILEHAYKSYKKPLPWQYYKVRDSRTLLSLWPDVEAPPASHHALEDCRRQIVMVQDTLKYFKIKEMR